MKNENEVHWPGQVPVLTFNAEQLKALTSSKRSSVFWAFNADDPLSVEDVGRLVGLTAQGVRYHTNVLLEVDLLVVAETRRKYARIQEAYVKKGLMNFSPLPPYPSEELKYRIQGFRAMWRQFERDRIATNMLENVDPSKGFRSYLRRNMPRLSFEHYQQFLQDINALFEKYDLLDDPNEPLFTLAAFAGPVFGESAREFERLTGKKLKIEFASDTEGPD